MKCLLLLIVAALVLIFFGVNALVATNNSATSAAVINPCKYHYCKADTKCQLNCESRLQPLEFCKPECVRVMYFYDVFEET